MVAPADIPLVTSRQNTLIKEVRSVRDDRASTMIFLEGPHLLQEALNAKLRIVTLVLDAAADADPPKSWSVEAWSQLTLDAARHAQRAVRVPFDVFESLADVESPQGVIALAERPGREAGKQIWDMNTLLQQPSPWIVIMDGLQDPGNAAAVIRTAEAAGVHGIVTTPGTARLYSPKALRSAMGSSFRLPVLEHQSIETIASALKAKSIRLIGTDQAGTNYSTINWKDSFALILGQEGQGMSDAWKPHLTETAHIPMKSPVESLNVGAAAAVLLFEAARQRR